MTRLHDFDVEGVRDVLRAMPCHVRTGRVAEALAPRFIPTDNFSQMVGKFLKRHQLALGIRWSAPPKKTTDPLEKGSLWERTGHSG